MISLAWTACSPAPTPPSILLVTLDTLRRDHVGAYGSPLGLTPHLDALAAEGLLHAAAYTTMPTTGPAHLSLFTGLQPHQHGGRRNGEPLLPEFAAREAAALLREHGYTTAAFVSSTLISPSATGLRGFEIYDAPHEPLRASDAVVSQALAWLNVEPRRPVFLWVHLYDAHAPYGSADEKRRTLPVDVSSYGWVDPDRYPGPADRVEMEARYARGVASADAALGRLVAGVRARLEQPPLVIAVADHGESLSEHLGERGYAYDHGKYLDEEGVAIPLLLAGPGVTPGRSTGTASIRDLYTTILEAAGVGDGLARQEQRRDLRRPAEQRRIARIERRRFRSDVPDSVRRHAAAAADGDELVIVAEDGSSPAASDARLAELLRAARELLDARRDHASAERVDPDTREALRALGYVD
ncbi:MAG: sulfatase [Myxococcota bacterium]